MKKVFANTKHFGVQTLAVESWTRDGVVNGFGGKNLSLKALEDGLLAQESKLLLLKQVHGNRVLAAESIKNREQEADGIFLTSGSERLVAGVITADCVPVLALDLGSKSAAALHCGWRGTVEGIIEDFSKHISSDHKFQFAIGPCAQVCCYEVKNDVSDLIPSFVVETKGKTFLDIPALLTEQIKNHFGENSTIYNSGLCTICSDDYYSHRCGDEGRQVSFIGVKS